MKKRKEVKKEIAKESMQYLAQEENKEQLVSILIDDDDFCGTVLDLTPVWFSTKGDWSIAADEKYDIHFECSPDWEKSFDWFPASKFFTDEGVKELRDIVRDELESKLDKAISEIASEK